MYTGGRFRRPHGATGRLDTVARGIFQTREPDSDLSFGLIQLDREYHILDQRRFRWTNVDNEDHIRYVAGFDIVAND